MSIFTVQCMREGQAPQVNRLRVSAYRTASWFVLSDADRIAVARDEPDTEVLCIHPEDRPDRLVGTMAITRAFDEASRAFALGADVARFGFPLPSYTVGRLAVEDDHRGFRLNHLMRGYMLRRALETGIAAICSSQARGTPNIGGMESMGYRFVEVSEEAMDSVRLEPGSLLVNLLLREQFAGALDRIDTLLAEKGIGSAWGGRPLFPAAAN